LEAVSHQSPEHMGPGDLVVISILGGYTPDRVRRFQVTIELMRGVYDSGDIPAALPRQLDARLGEQLGRRRATNLPAIKNDLINAGAPHRDEEVVDDRLIASGGRPTCPPSCKEYGTP